MSRRREAEAAENLASEWRKRFTLAVVMNDMQLNHEDGMEDNTYGNQRVNHVQTSTWEKDRVSSESLSSLDAIAIQELCRSKRHRGRVLYGKFCIEPFMSQSVNDIVTILVDTNANSIRVIMSKLLWTASQQETQSRFSLEKNVAIIEPLVEVCVDGMPAVRLINLADVVLVENDNTKGHTEPVESNGSVALEKIRCEGNQLFAKQNWAGAAKKYSECINEAGKLYSSGSTETKNQEELMLAYSNRAEARLRLQHYEDALGDAHKALKIEPKHLKTLVRKGKAAHALGLFEKACEAFKAALGESPEEQFVMESLKASTTALQQSRTGEYDLSDYFLGDDTDEVQACADFMGPVEIRRVGYDCKGRRGLFATRSVEAGELLLVSNPLVAVRHECLVHPFLWASREFIDFKIRTDLMLEVSKRVKTSKRQMAQLHSLCGNRKDEMAIPSMELFRPGSEWVPEDQGEFEMDSDLIYDIVNSNVTRKDVINQWRDGVSNRITEGIWILPAFANHSCVPNMIDYVVGNARFFRASVDISEGEELTRPYDNSSLLWKGLEARREGDAFACRCARCRLEETMRPKLSKIMKVYQDLERDYNFAAVAGLPQQHQTQRDLSKVADAVEVVLQSEGSDLGSNEQGWIRASFLPAYTEKSQLIKDNGDFESAISVHRLVLDSITSVCVCPLALVVARGLFMEVQQRYSKRSKSYRRTLDRVLGVFKTFCGDLPKDTLLKVMMQEDS